MTVLNFNQDGLLPAGDYELSFSELRASTLVTGPGREIAPNWDRVWRSKLVGNLELLVRQLWQVGVTDVFADGSFAQDKDHPNDIDGYFQCDPERLFSGRLTRDLNALDPHQVWTWDPGARRHDRVSGKAQLPMWHTYRVELFPHYRQSSGIRDQFGNELEFPAAFRRSRSGGPRGIIKLRQTP